MGNIITIPVDQIKLFAEVVRQFQEQGLAYRVVATQDDFLITVTGY